MGAAPTNPAETVEIDLRTPLRTPLPHFLGKNVWFWPRHPLVGATTTATTCAKTKRITNFDYVRFHAIFHDEVGVYDEDANGKPVYNFSYVDQIYDGLLANKVRPFVELSFMPKKLTSDPNALHGLLVQAKTLLRQKMGTKWGRLIEAFHAAPWSSAYGHRRGFAVVFRGLE